MNMKWFKNPFKNAPTSVVPTTPALAGLTGGVFIRQPNGSATALESFVVNLLTKQGIALFSLDTAAGKLLLESGGSVDLLCTKRLDVLVVGRVIVQAKPIKVAVCNSIQHLDAKGDNTIGVEKYNDYSRNVCLWDCVRNARAYTVPGDEYYREEPDEQYKRRRLAETTYKEEVQTVYRTDLTFFGSDDQIYGNYLGECSTGNSELEALTELSRAACQSLIDCSVSVYQHQRARAVGELRGFAE